MSIKKCYKPSLNTSLYLIRNCIVNDGVLVSLLQVLELNASSRRTGKTVTAKLAEATQSQSFKQTQSHFLSSAQSHQLLAALSPRAKGIVCGQYKVKFALSKCINQS